MVEESLDLLDGLDVDIPALETPGVSRGAEAQFFGPYQLITQVGYGGVAKVWRARHIHPRYADHTFAIKILHNNLSRDPKVIELFRHEAYILSLLKHPSIVQTFEAGRQDDKLFIAMEYIDGRDLDNLVERCKRAKFPLPMPVALYVVSEALKALTYAHELVDGNGVSLNLVHRDVNPANVFISYDGRVKLGDFGVASIAAGELERTKELAGKVGYFAPEQLAGDPVDHRVDIFAVGVMIFELLTGQRLFDADTTDKALRLNKRAKIPRPTKLNANIPGGLEDVMLRALERKPEDRFASGGEMLSALKPYVPASDGLSLAIAALMRKVFLNEHMQELQLNEGLAGGHGRGSGQLVAVCTDDERAQAAFRELLVSRGYRVNVVHRYGLLSKAITGFLPQAVLLDVNAQDFNAEAWLSAQSKVGTGVPVVAVGSGLDGESVRRAHALGAVDLLFKPFNIERVLTSVRAAVTGAARISRVDGEAATAIARVRCRVLVVSSDAALVQRLTQHLVTHHAMVHIAADAAAALERSREASYHAVVYDVAVSTPSDRLFASHFRAGVGMGLVPILYLSASDGREPFAGLEADRAVVRPRSDSAAALTQCLQRLTSDTQLGRTFIRFPANFVTEVRYGGRVFEGQAIDISRGGVFVRCGQMPPVGTEISVVMRLPGAAGPVEVSGRVARVHMDAQGAGIGVEFESFAGRGEATLIAFIAEIDHHAPSRRSTVIVGTTPR